MARDEQVLAQAEAEMVTAPDNGDMVQARQDSLSEEETVERDRRIQSSELPAPAGDEVLVAAPESTDADLEQARIAGGETVEPDVIDPRVLEADADAGGSEFTADGINAPR